MLLGMCSGRSSYRSGELVNRALRVLAFLQKPLAEIFNHRAGVEARRAVGKVLSLARQRDAERGTQTVGNLSLIHI